MVKIVSDDPDVEKGLHKLCDLVTKNGGLIHDSLTIGSRKGDFLIEASDKTPGGEKILILPKELLLPVDKFKIRAEKNKMVLKSHDDDVSPVRIALMEVMLDLFNLTGKLKQTKDFATLGLLKSAPEFLDAIVRHPDGKREPYLQQVSKMEDSEFWVELFMKSRVLGFYEKVENPNADNETENQKQPGEMQKMVMPIIDFLNHHPRAFGYYTSFADPKAMLPTPENNEELYYDNDGVAILKCCPIKGSRECYVTYGRYDAREMFYSYYYVDKQIKFVRSVPLEIKVPGMGTLVVNAMNKPPQFKELPDVLKDLRFYLPGIKAWPEKKLVTVSTLMVPASQAPRALRRVLQVALSHFKVDYDDSMMMDAVRFAEQRVVQENVAYYNELLAFMETYKPNAATKMIAANAKELAQDQLARLRDYAFYDEAMAGVESAKPAKKAARKAG